MATHQDTRPLRNIAPASSSTSRIGAAASAATPLVVIREDPFNAETPVEEHRGIITPTEAFYVRSHFAVPRLDLTQWRLSLEGSVEQTKTWQYEELLALPRRTLLVTLECAGNGRGAMRPQPLGEPWGYGAVSTAEWTGVPLADLVRQARLTSDAVEIVAEGADSGFVDDARGSLSFARSLPLVQALHPDTLVAYAMNGKPLTPQHGFPARLIVPGWYGVASVKWLTRLSAVAEPFDGFYQKERYILTPTAPSAEYESAAERSKSTPLTTVAIRSLLVRPASRALLPCGIHRVHGLAWSGVAPITRVEVSFDGGVRWETAALIGDPSPYAWREWECHWEATSPGRTQLCSRAFDAAGNSQPVEAMWNALGYANNAIQRVTVEIQ